MARKKGYYWVVVATSNEERIAYYDGKNWDLMTCKSGLFNENIIKKCGAWVGDSFMREQANELLPLVRQRCIDFANWIKKQNLMICTGYDKEDATWRSSMIGGKKFTDEQLYYIFESGGNVAG